MSRGELDDYRQVAVRAARAAGASSLRRFGRLDAASIGFKGGRDMVTAADLESEQIIKGMLREAFPDHLILAEEEVSGATLPAAGSGVDPATRPAGEACDLVPLRARVEAAPRAWVIDPLDGTTNYAHSHPFYSISIALMEHGRPLLGVVFAPRLDELFVAVRGGGATLSDRPLAVSTEARLGDAIFATGFPYRRDRLTAEENNVGPMQRFILDVRGFRRCGSAAIDLAYVAAGRYAFFFEAQLEPWDVAAGALLVREAGGVVTDYGGGDDWLFGRRIVASNGHLHDTVRARLEAPSPAEAEGAGGDASGE